MNKLLIEYLELQLLEDDWLYDKENQRYRDAVLDFVNAHRGNKNE